MAKSSTADALQSIIMQLARLDRTGRLRIMRAVEAYFGDSEIIRRDFREANDGRPFVRDRAEASESSILDRLIPLAATRRENEYSFEDAAEVSPKDFLAAKRPGSEVERVTCLAFFLTHMAKQKHFKTLDISRLNTEAAQPKLSNAA